MSFFYMFSLCPFLLSPPPAQQPMGLGPAAEPMWPGSAEMEVQAGLVTCSEARRKKKIPEIFHS